MEHTREQILESLRNIMHELFEIDPKKIELNTRLYEELDLDSIDAVDLIVQLQTITKRKFKPEEFKAVRTISDIVEVIYAELAKK